MSKSMSNKEKIQDTVIDLKARFMWDNLLFHNVPEDEKENTSDKIYKILEENLQFPDAREKIKIDRFHRVGKKRDSNPKPRAIVYSEIQLFSKPRNTSE